MTKAKRGLGRGLGAIFGDEVVQEVAQDHQESVKRENNGEKDSEKEKTSNSGIKYATGEKVPSGKRSASNLMKEEAGYGSGEVMIKISKIEPNREQPRKDFNEEQLKELADSIRQYGILQPLLVQKKNGGYEIIAGERRWRTAKIASLKEVPVVIREYNEQQTVEIALIENVQREDLNPIEEALAYQRLMQEFHLKQEEIAERVAKNRTTITNSMRLLNLAPEVRKMLIDNQITSGHARALLAIENPEVQIKFAERIEKEHLSVREVEKLVKQLGKAPREKKKKETDEALELIFRNLEDRMKSVMGTKVNISRKDKTKGRIEIEYYSEAELERIVELIESIR